MIYALIGAVVIGIALGLLGSGGSIITVPILVYLLHHEEKAAIAESLAIVGMISLFGALRARRAGLLDLHSAALFGTPGIAGTLFGAYLANWVPGSVQLLLLSVVMLGAAAIMFFARSLKPRASPQRPLLIIVQGLTVGITTGLVGVGGGFLIVPALVLLMGLSMPAAVATSLAIITLNAAAGFMKYQMVLSEHGLSVHWPTVLTFTLLGIGGSLIGGTIGARINPNILRRAFAGFLILMAAYILYREISVLTPAGRENPAADKTQVIGNLDGPDGLSLVKAVARSSWRPSVENMS